MRIAMDRQVRDRSVEGVASYSVIMRVGGCAGLLE